MLRDSSALVVEDSKTVRHYVASILKSQLNCGQVYEAETADEALAMLNSGVRIEWIFSDWEMPGMPGDQFLIEVRKNPKTTSIPFIMITGRNDKESLVVAAQAGVTDYLVKPFTASILMQKVRRLISLHERRVMERFKAQNKNRVQILFSDATPIEAALLDLSGSGCMVRAPSFRGLKICIYDLATLTIHMPEGNVQLNAELVRMESDREEPPSRQFITAAFRFTDNDHKSIEKLTCIIEKFRDNVNAPPPNGVE